VAPGTTRRIASRQGFRQLLTSDEGKVSRVVHRKASPMVAPWFRVRVRGVSARK
jgi:hypothetical protein